MRMLWALVLNVFLVLLWILRAPLVLLGSFRRRSPVDYVQLRLKGELPYRASSRRRRFLNPRGPTEPDLVPSIEALSQALDELGRDRTLKGIVLVVEGFEGPVAKREAVQALLERFKAKGKRVVGFATQVGNEGYALLATADRIILSSAARLDLRGYAAEANSLGGAFELLGVKAEFIRRGAYKTAPEMFTHRELSDIQRQTLEGFLDERFAALVEALGARPGLTPERARALIDGGPYSARRALKEGLCDGLASEADLTRWAEEGRKVRIENLAVFRRSRRFAAPRWARLRRRPRLGMVALRGMIVDAEGGGIPGGPRVASAPAIRKALAKAAGDRRSRALLLYIDSPGGSALGSELLLEEVKRVAQKKPVVAYFDRVAASGGYMALLGAKEVWAAPHAVAGSIGVFAGKFDLSELLSKVGIRRTVIQRGRNAAIYSSAKSFDQSERLAMEETVEDTYQSFLEHVAAARKLTVAEAHARGEGRVYSGRRAMEARLVDRLGGFEEAAARAMALAGVEGRFDLLTYAPSTSRFGFLNALRSLASASVYALDLSAFEL